MNHQASSHSLAEMFDRAAETMPRSELTALQLARLKHTLNYAYENVPHVRKKFDAAGVRPEHFALADDGVEAVVQVVEPTGSETQVVARLGQGDVIAVFRERHPFKPGDRIRLRPDPKLVHLFDEATGKRLTN